MVASLVSKFGLPRSDAVLVRCFSAVDTTIEMAVGRIRDYFLVEGKFGAIRI